MDVDVDVDEDDHTGMPSVTENDITYGAGHDEEEREQQLDYHMADAAVVQEQEHIIEDEE